MIKPLIACLITLFLVSCTDVNSSDEKTIKQGDDTVSEVEVSVSKLDALTNLVEEEAKKDQKIVFKASGFEPGWFAEFYEHKLRLVVDYGKDSVIIDDSFEHVNDENGFSYTKTFTANNKPQSVTISVQNKPCTEASGNVTGRTVIVKYNTSIYKGCGGS